MSNWLSIKLKTSIQPLLHNSMFGILPRRLFSSTPMSRSADAFADLARITSTAPITPLPSSSVPSTSGSAFASPVQSTSSTRGYPINAMPAKFDPLLELFTNLIMKHGMKQQARRRVQDVLEKLQRATNQPPLPLLHRAIELAAPQVKNVSIRIGAKSHSIPRSLDERQRMNAGIRALLKASNRGRAHITDRLAREIIAVLEGSSTTYQRLEEVHRMAMLNRCVRDKVGMLTFAAPRLSPVSEGRGSACIWVWKCAVPALTERGGGGVWGCFAATDCPWRRQYTNQPSSLAASTAH